MPSLPNLRSNLLPALGQARSWRQSRYNVLPSRYWRHDDHWDKKELIEQFIASISPTGDIDDEWRQYVNDQKREQFAQIVSEEHLRPEPARTFIADAFERGYVPEGGMELDGIMPPINPFDRSANRQGKIQQVLSRLKSFFLKFADIANAEF